MSIYTLESPNSPSRVATRLLVVDTSYMQDLADKHEEDHISVHEFHTRARAQKAKFRINDIVRQEFIKLVRKSHLIESIIDSVARDAQLEQRYRGVTGITRQELSPHNLRHDFERIYKDHIKQDDMQLLLSVLRLDALEVVLKLEMRTGIYYSSSPEANRASWEALGELVKVMGMSPADANIVLFALSIGADAIVTTDIDYIPMH